MRSLNGNFQEAFEKGRSPIEEVVERLIDELSEDDKQYIKDLDRNSLIELHFGLGMYIRNEFGLWKNNDALMKACGAMHPDDASMVIIEALWDKLQD